MKDAYGKTPSLLRSYFLCASFLLFVFPWPVWACASCMVGRLSGQQGRAAAGAVLTLLAILGVVYLAVVAFGYRLWKRAKAPLPPYAQFTRLDEEEHPLEVDSHDY
ncbi:hypothetical protein [Candidatus Methylacidithermus pantelleriae]|uniref:Uncharacterized protein n=1 Tax=Candidatus Methylacidithermus pantelleriae TaxID=2744239 RepID=A0A8J2FV14_9BACT|nr:hypothetical protein [Candidatus Methylacidithermus pantelleriae]CAF0689631.1 hypothetical protein MPNT_10289 [Candidatus Methylacidithermus pantelleriae]